KHKTSGFIYIYKEECLSVCLFAMHSDTVQPNETKFCKEYPFIQGKVMTGFSGPKVGFWEGFEQVFWKTIRNFLRFFKKFEEFSDCWAQGGVCPSYCWIHYSKCLFQRVCARIVSQ